MAKKKRRSKAGLRYSPVITLFFALLLIIITSLVLPKGLSLFHPDTDVTKPTDNVPETQATFPVIPDQTAPSDTVPGNQTEPPETAEPPLPSDPAQKIRAYAERHGYAFSDYPESLVELLGKNPETEKYVLEYPFAKDEEYVIDLSREAQSDTVPLLIQWDQRWGYIRYGSDMGGMTACGPTCLSMVTMYLTKDPKYTPAYMMQYALDNHYYVNGAGTSWSLFSEGAKGLGLNAEELTLNKDRIVKSLEAGKPVVCAMSKGYFTEQGHYIVLVGVEDGKFRVNDPNSPIRSGQLWDYKDIKNQIRNLWAISLK